MANNILIKRNKGIQKNKKYYFLSFVKILKSKKEVKESRPCQQCWVNNQHASAVWMIWVMDSIPWVRCASGNVSYFRIPIFLVIRIVFHFTPRIPTILVWPSASATCIYDIDYELQGIALNWHHQSYWLGIIISQSHISKVSTKGVGGT